jgi:hypothetical protein
MAPDGMIVTWISKAVKESGDILAIYFHIDGTPKISVDPLGDRQYESIRLNISYRW